LLVFMSAVLTCIFSLSLHDALPIYTMDMLIFTLYGYIGMATFYLVSQWLAQYGQFVAGIPYASAIKLLSIYTVGSLTCVFVTARSEEHTSELQSRFDIVCRLLLVNK